MGGRIEIAEQVERSSVHATIAIASLDTGNALRDAHVRSADFLDAERFPTMEFRGSGLSQASENAWVLDGQLSLHGEVRGVRLEVAYQGVGGDPFGGTRAAFKATTTLNRDDFGVSYNQILRAGAVLIGSEVRVELDIEAVQGTTLPELDVDSGESVSAAL